MVTQGPCNPDRSAPRQAFVDGTTTAVAHVTACLDQIERFENRLRAWVAVDAEGALRQARELDAARAARAAAGPLAAVVLGVKDIIDVQGLPTRAGSPLTSTAPAAADAPVVAWLRRAGAIILGKTVTTEFACFDPPPTRNPWNLQATPGGSSSGSAVAVATGMSVAALGTQTGGSILRPAAYCGVCGIKPTFGTVSREGVVPVSRTLDHVGCLTASVADLKVVWQVIADSARAAGGKLPPAKSPSRAPKLGVVEALFGEASGEVSGMVQKALQRLRAAGARLEPVAAQLDFPLIRDVHRTIMAFEAADYHQATYGSRRIGYGPNLQSLLEEGSLVAESTYRAALAQRERLIRQAAGFLAKVDAWIMPATPTAAPPPDTTGDARFNSPWSLLGVPAVTLPCGLAPSNGTPIGVQLVGRAQGDAALLDWAAWCEAQLGFAPWQPQVFDQGAN